MLHQSGKKDKIISPIRKVIKFNKTNRTPIRKRNKLHLSRTPNNQEDKLHRIMKCQFTDTACMLSGKKNTGHLTMSLFCSSKIINTCYIHIYIYISLREKCSPSPHPNWCSEAGDLGDKYWGIRAAIGKYSPLPPLPPSFPNSTQKGEVGTVNMR